MESLSTKLIVTEVKIFKPGWVMNPLAQRSACTIQYKQCTYETSICLNIGVIIKGRSLRGWVGPVGVKGGLH